jgi:hypothetical protein
MEAGIDDHGWKSAPGADGNPLHPDPRRQPAPGRRKTSRWLKIDARVITF